MTKEIRDVIITGAGPAGVACAVQLGRYKIKPLVLERDGVGGLLRNANLVENYPGFPVGITGVELVKLLKEQLRNEGVEVKFEEVLSLGHNDDLFIVKTDERTLKARIVVIASGTRPRRLLDIEIPDELRDRILYEVHPIRDISGKRVIIVGAGDCAFDYALTLGDRNDVMILNRSAEHKCNDVLWERVNSLERIDYHIRSWIVSIEKGLRGRLKVGYVRNLGKRIIKKRFDYILIAIGREPQLNFVSDELKKRIEELLSEKKLFLIGDVKNDIYRQTAIAIGDGVRAGMEIGGVLKEDV